MFHLTDEVNMFELCSRHLIQFRIIFWLNDVTSVINKKIHMYCFQMDNSYLFDKDEEKNVKLTSKADKSNLFDVTFWPFLKIWMESRAKTELWSK